MEKQFEFTHVRNFKKKLLKIVTIASINEYSCRKTIFPISYFLSIFFCKTYPNKILSMDLLNYQKYF